MRLLLATRNPGKLRELKELLAGLPLQLVSLNDLGIDLEVPEVGETFRENAVLKATGYAAASGLVTLADDSGLEVRALGGEPGIRSARWAGPGATDRDRIRLLLERLRDVPPAERQAQFHCVAAVATPGGQVVTTEGTVQGLIIDEPRGTQGFGYDPVFLLPAIDKTMAELPPAEKNHISHRAQAVCATRPVLEDMAAEEKEGSGRV